jgi:hypothetical protein
VNSDATIAAQSYGNCESDHFSHLGAEPVGFLSGCAELLIALRRTRTQSPKLSNARYQPLAINKQERSISKLLNNFIRPREQ